MRNVYINTMGCQMNVYDSRRILDALEKLGYEETQEPANADLLMINTCYIREKASDKVFSMLGKFAEIKQSRKEKGLSTYIGLAGCVVQALGDEVFKKATREQLLELMAGKSPDEVFGKKEETEDEKIGL